ncbi:autorepressor SdpR family transcription factor [Gorillibacterium sp. CAU 1737]|uniref:autorepressor SdpR family transcription factor n=1 Tax=Gorillibacterium sp. CAU 1737 TaxID=3140362 RepID=UPI0032617892
MNESFKALSDPTRRRIIDLLKERDRTAGELAQHFDMSKPSLSHHLNTLKHAGLIQDEREGQFIRYTLNTTVLQEVLGWFLSITGTGTGSSKNKNEEDSHS